MKTRKNKPKPYTIRNKHLAQEIARCCAIPIEEGHKILRVILAYLVKEIRAHKSVKLASFGRWSLWKPKHVHLPDGSLVKPVKYRCKFTPSRFFKLRVLRDTPHPLDQYASLLRYKIRRLRKEGDKKGAKHAQKLFDSWTKNKPEVLEWLRKHGGLP